MVFTSTFPDDVTLIAWRRRTGDRFTLSGSTRVGRLSVRAYLVVAVDVQSNLFQAAPVLRQAALHQLHLHIEAVVLVLKHTSVNTSVDLHRFQCPRTITASLHVRRCITFTRM